MSGPRRQWGGRFGISAPAKWARVVNKVDDVNDLVADAAGRNSVRPADDEWRTQRGFHGRKVGAAPWTSVAFPGVSGLRSVVAGEDDERVLFNTSFAGLR